MACSMTEKQPWYFHVNLGTLALLMSGVEINFACYYRSDWQAMSWFWIAVLQAGICVGQLFPRRSWKATAVASAFWRGFWLFPHTTAMPIDSLS